MQIHSLPIRPSLLQIVVFIFLILSLLVYVQVTGDIRVLIWAIPTLIIMLIIPMILSYMSQKEYEDLVPVYQAEARSVRIREINESMLSKPVRFEGLVEEVRFRSLNRPHFIVADRTGSIPVKMFTNPREDIRPGDVVEVLGQVIHRYMVTGDPVINGVSIRVITSKRVSEAKKKKK